MIFDVNFHEYIYDKLKKINHSDEIKFYVQSTLTQGLNASADLSNNSIVLLYENAKSFYDYQLIGDWVIFMSALFTKRLEKHENVNVTIAGMSFNNCYNLLRRNVKIYDDLQANFPLIIKDLKELNF